MRDGNRLKEKIELRLDQRQVVSLAVVALLLSAGLFALGVMVGKNLAAMGSPKAASGPEGLLDRLDESAGLADAGPKLTFQEELTKRAPPEAPPPAPKAKPKPKAAEPPAAAKPKEASAIPAAPSIPSTLKAAPPPAAPPEGARPSEVAADSHPVEAAGAPVAAAVPSKLFFTIQVKATQSAGEARKFSQKLKGDGFSPFLAEVDIPGKGHWFRVRVGRFDTRAKADEYLADFERETHLQAFVTAGR